MILGLKNQIFRIFGILPCALILFAPPQESIESTHSKHQVSETYTYLRSDMELHKKVLMMPIVTPFCHNYVQANRVARRRKSLLVSRIDLVLDGVEAHMTTSSEN